MGLAGGPGNEERRTATVEGQGEERMGSDNAEIIGKEV
jgi:hypothetical protein